VTVLGLPELLVNLSKAEVEIVEASKLGLLAAAEEVRKEWVANIEANDLILTGHYRDSVKVDTDGETIAVVSDVPYSGILEFGDSRQEAHFPATRAADENHDSVLGAVHEKVEKAL
jgi:hypothetical protein